MRTLFADIILPLSLPKNYTYRVPKELNDHIKKGHRVLVPFGKRRFYAGLVYSVHDRAPENYTAKYVEALLDESPIITELQLNFWEWVANYYMANLGDVYSAAIPSGFRLDSETKVVLHPEAEIDPARCTEHELSVIEALEMREVLSLDDISAILDIKTIFPVLNSLVHKRIVLTKEELSERYRIKTKDLVISAVDFSDENAARKAFDRIGRAHKQEAMLLHFLKQTDAVNRPDNSMYKQDLLKETDSSHSVLNGLLEKEILQIVPEEVSRLRGAAFSDQESVHLSQHQYAALSNIHGGFEEEKPVLLHGVTGSGKTEVYIKLIEEALERGEQVLYLLPEIALTSQIVHRLQKYFGEDVAVFHSKFNQNERVEIWHRLMGNSTHNSFKIVLGARSALFMPFKNLGLIIVDEEHETTFKQMDPAPRYQARDAAIVLAQMHKAGVVLGSATPSLESYYNVQKGKYALAELTERFSGVEMPEIHISDLAEAFKKEVMKEQFGPELFEAIDNTLQKGEQVILFQNRRGFSPFVQCNICGWAPECNHCDISLTYHKFKHLLICHYCGFKEDMPKECKACGSADIELKGIGTEMIEESIGLLLPEAKISRMDLDTTSGKHTHEKIIEQFERREIDILVGTQMVTKGLDFENVGLVGVVSADQLLQFPHFRAHERAYQLLSQVAGRAGRKDKQGDVIIQSFKPQHAVLKMVKQQDYKSLFENQIQERQKFDYPPFQRLITVHLKDKDALKCAKAAHHITSLLQKKLAHRVLGPEKPPVGRVKNYYLQQILLKIEPRLSLDKVKEYIELCIIDTKSNTAFRSVRIYPDVDPQ